MMRTSLTLAASLAVLVGACGDRENKTAQSAPATSPAPVAPAPAAPVTGPGTSSPSTAAAGAVTPPLDPAPPPSWSATPSPSSPEGAPPSAAVATADAGDSGAGIYNKVCSLCHAAAVAGAPKPGDKADWGPRIAQGKDVLYKHAIEGFTGAKGLMPPRGGNPALKDEEVKAAVDYMVAKSQ